MTGSYPPVGRRAVEPATGSPATTHDTDPSVTTERRYGPSDGTHDPTTGTADELNRLRARVARLEGVLHAIRGNARRGNDVTADIVDVCTIGNTAEGGQ